MKKRKMRLQNKFLFSIFMLILIPLIFVPIVGYIYSSNILSTKLEELSEKNAEETASDINKVIENMINASNIVYLDREIQNYISDANDYYSIMIRNRYIINTLDDAIISNLYLYDAKMVFVDFKGNVYSSDKTKIYTYKDVVEEQWFPTAVLENGFFSWYAPSKGILDFGNGITLTRLIKISGNNLGVLVVHVSNDKYFSKLLKRNSDYEDTERYLVNENMRIVSSNIDFNKKNFSFDDRKDILKYSVEINKTGWQIIQIIPKSVILQEVKGYRDFIIIINILFLIFLMITSLIISRQITKAINKLNSSVQEVTDGRLDIKVNVSGSYEVEQLGKNFNFMIDKVNFLLESVREEEKEKIKYKLEALQSQINPHFLLNTLNGIKWLCVIENAKTSEEMLKSLGYILEKTLYLKNDYIIIEEEIKCIESYIKLQKMRFGKRFEVNYWIDKDTLNSYIPVLLLQPIIENSILHGFAYIEFGGVINISILSKGDFIEIIIEDNGKGFDKKTDTFTNKNTKKDIYDSIGISNVYSRIKLNYKEPCGIWINSEKDKGTKTRILLNKILDNVSDF